MFYVAKCRLLALALTRQHHNKIFEEMILPFVRRHNVKPGITGWAQVNGYRGPADTLQNMEKRIECDLFYIDNWSFFFDLKIILMTMFSKKAYQKRILVAETLFVLREAIHIADLGRLIPRSADQKLDIVSYISSTDGQS